MDLGSSHPVRLRAATFTVLIIGGGQPFPALGVACKSMYSSNRRSLQLVRTCYTTYYLATSELLDLAMYVVGEFVEGQAPGNGVPLETPASESSVPWFAGGKKKRLVAVATEVSLLECDCQTTTHATEHHKNNCAQVQLVTLDSTHCALSPLVCYMYIYALKTLTSLRYILNWLEAILVAPPMRWYHSWAAWQRCTRSAPAGPHEDLPNDCAPISELLFVPLRS